MPVHDHRQLIHALPFHRALALLKDLDGQLGRRFPDVLVGDALYLQSPFVKEVEGLGLDWAFTLKENQPELLREASWAVAS